MPTYVEHFWHDEDPAGAFTAQRGKEMDGGIIAAQETANTTLIINELREKEVNLGNQAGIVKIDLSKGRIFKLTATGDIIVQFTNIPAGESAEVTLIATQDAVGGHKIVVENIEWNNGEPLLTTVKETKQTIPILVLTSGTVIGFGGATGYLKTTTNITTIGEGAGGSSTAKGTVAIGRNALKSLEAGEANVAGGENALTTNKAGKGNSAWGHNALNKQTGSEASAFGYEALAQNTSNNVSAFGSFALTSNTTGTGNTGMGRSVLFTNKTGNNNTGFGANCLEKSTNSSNTGFGAACMEQLSTGIENSGFGHEAMKAATTTVQSVAFGRKALGALTEGVHNTAFGYNAGGTIKTGEANVFIGWEAGALLGAAESNKLFIHNSSSAEPLILGDFSARELTVNSTKISFYKGVAPVSQSATFAALGEAGSSTVKQLEEQCNKLRAVIKGPGLMA